MSGEPRFQKYATPMTPEMRAALNQLKEEAKALNKKCEAAGIDCLFVVGGMSCQTSTAQFDLCNIGALMCNLLVRTKEQATKGDIGELLGRMAMIAILHNNLSFLDHETPITEFSKELALFYETPKETGDPVKDARVKGQG
jgi:hypothetical protein